MMLTGGMLSGSVWDASGDAGWARTGKHGSASSAAKATNQLLLRRASLPVCFAIEALPALILSTRIVSGFSKFDHGNLSRYRRDNFLIVT